ncbi:hypothetical protein B296_00058374 [Ensete ventricosum]|uniref:NAC domain-containing protein n=1 Tax=Ensete ventricosum TaxID=4639 RepID=A0A426XMI1_ENSVE|nr:hypothetical protein B296_00058374 [Ensete ventricosum]
MDRKPSAVARHGVLRLPPGFRFHPTDEELVVQYLKRKTFSCPLPAAIIPEINLSRLDPWDLPALSSRCSGGCEEERYFFNLREAKYPRGSRSNRAARSGYWKATGKDKQITSSWCSQVVVGMRKVLVFYRGKPPMVTKTDWIMHEYRLAGPETRACIFPQRKNSTHVSSPSVDPSGDWVLCRIFRKKRATKTEVETDEAGEEDEDPITRNGFIDFMGQRGGDQSHSTSCSSGSSCVTERADGSSSTGEETSSSRSLP